MFIKYHEEPLTKSKSTPQGILTPAEVTKARRGRLAKVFEHMRWVLPNVGDPLEALAFTELKKYIDLTENWRDYASETSDSD